MGKNPYQVLGLTTVASDSDIRAAFRKLAKKYHPDRNPGDQSAEDKFKEISAAFEILGDKDKRAKFDRGEIDADGRERAYSPFGAGRDSAGGYSNGYGNTGGPGAGASFEDLGDIFSDLFGNRRANAMRGRDLRYRLEVDFLDAANGAKKRVTMPDGRNLELSVPAGLEDGQTLRLKGQGEKGHGGAAAGDVYVEVQIKPDDTFTRDGSDVHVEVPISLRVAVLGGKITAPTVHGDVTLKIPKNVSSGTILRLKGRGIATGGTGKKSAANGDKTAGDQYVKLRIVLPDGGDKELEEFMRTWRTGKASEPHQKTESA